MEFKRESHIVSDINPFQVLDSLQIFDENNVVKCGRVLFFAEHPENYFFHAVIRCVMFKGTEKVYLLDDKTFGGPLLQQYKKAMEWLKDKLQVSYIIEGTGPRKEVWEIPLGVFKEAIINALAHRDYDEQGASITIELFDDRVEISNPGTLLPVVAKNFGKKSLSRNPLIFGLFTRMHLVEHIGSGIPRMRKEMLDAGLPQPVFETEGMFSIVLSRPRKDNVLHLNDMQAKLIEVMRRNPFMSMKEMGEEMGVGRTSIYKIIRSLKELNILEYVGRKNHGKWVVKI